MCYCKSIFLFIYTNRIISPNQIRPIFDDNDGDTFSETFLEGKALINFVKQNTQAHTHTHTQPYTSKVAAICSAIHEYLIHHLT